ncbi:MAG TPA: DsrE family protein [Rhodocyclaceae bacterium]|nr:DsrE family protein [Rhodocyclaceae bacterium]
MRLPTSLRRLALLLCLAATAAFADGPVKVVYHFSEGLEQAGRGLRNISNHLGVDPGAKIVAVAHGAGIDFLLKGAKDKNGNLYENTVGDLALAGVEFRVCNITLQSRGIDAKQVIGDARIVPSGVVEVAKLQAKEGFAYIKP